jgi:hypothetical protein
MATGEYSRIELYGDRPRTLWPGTSDRQMALFTRALDPGGLPGQALMAAGQQSGPRHP